jgi:hypothetical protein
MSKELRENALCGSSLILSAEMSGGCITFIDYLSNFCRRIQGYNLKPWGKKGRKFLEDGVRELSTTGAYDTLITCERCHKTFLVALNPKVIDLFLEYWREDIHYEDWVICSACGGIIEKI